VAARSPAARPAALPTVEAATPPGAFALHREPGCALSGRVGETEILRYHYRPELAASECPSPYFHPLRTLSGAAVTAHRPHDHRWHKGLAMTASHLSGQNFWGGGTYVHGAPGWGYVDLPNVGRLDHEAFSRGRCDDAGFSGSGSGTGSGTARPDATDPDHGHSREPEADNPDFTASAIARTGAEAGFHERVAWHNSTGERWITENRSVSIRDVEPANGCWTMEFATELLNVRGQALEFGSPTVFGRELAGYCGFFWRGPRSFTGGTVRASGGREGEPAAMGKTSPWLAFTGQLDERNGCATLLFVPDPANPGAEPYWFARTQPFPVVNPSLAYYEPLELAAGDTLRRRYRLVVADGEWDHDRIETYLAQHPW
jgi:hypothetical protein